MAPTVDALIIDGGLAGLTVALTLARQVQTCIVFDDNDYRNKRANHMHMVLTLDSERPKAFREKSRQNITSIYDTVQFEDTTITSVKKICGGFQAENTNGQKWKGKKLVLATGVSYIYPDIDGYDRCWAPGMQVNNTPLIFASLTNVSAITVSFSRASKNAVSHLPGFSPSIWLRQYL